jgi:hypothetical protein
MTKMKMTVLALGVVLLAACKNASNGTADGRALVDLGEFDAPASDLGPSETSSQDDQPVYDAGRERAADGGANLDGSAAQTLWAVSAGSAGLSERTTLSRLVVDSAGNIYIAGSFQGTATFGTITLTASTPQAIYVAKLDPNGKFLWVTSATGTNTGKVDVAYDVALDGAGGVYITGVYMKSCTFGSTVLSSSGKADLFVAKLDTSGSNKWAVSSSAAAGMAAVGRRLALDSSGNIYVAVEIAGTVGFGSSTVTSIASNGGMAVTKLSSSGSYLWATAQSGTGSQRVGGLAVDSAGSTYVIGRHTGTSTFGSTTLSTSGPENYDYDVYVAKLDTSGSFEWATGAGGTGFDYGFSIRLDSSGQSYITGAFRGSAPFGTMTLTSGAYDHLYLAKLDSAGSIVWATTTKDSGMHQASDLALDSSKDSYLVGHSNGLLDVGSTTLKAGPGFVAKADPQGKLVWGVSANKTGASTSDIDLQGIALDSSGDLIVGGNLTGSGYFGGKLLSTKAYMDLFVWKLKPGP